MYTTVDYSVEREVNGETVDLEIKITASVNDEDVVVTTAEGEDITNTFAKKDLSWFYCIWLESYNPPEEELPDEDTLMWRGER